MIRIKHFFGTRRLRSTVAYENSLDFPEILGNPGQVPRHDEYLGLLLDSKSLAIFGYALIPRTTDHSLSQNKGSTGVLDSLGNSYQWAMINSATLVNMKHNN